MRRNNSPWGYGFTACPFCDIKRLSTCGIGYASHMKKHIREGIARRDWDSDLQRYEYFAIARDKKEAK